MIRKIRIWVEDGRQHLVAAYLAEDHYLETSVPSPRKRKLMWIISFILGLMLAASVYYLVLHNH